MRYEIRDIRMPARVQDAMQMQVTLETSLILFDLYFDESLCGCCSILLLNKYATIDYLLSCVPSEAFAPVHLPRSSMLAAYDRQDEASRSIDIVVT